MVKIAQRQGNFAEWAKKLPTVCTSQLIPTGNPDTVVAEACCSPVRVSVGLVIQGQNCSPSAVVFIFSY